MPGHSSPGHSSTHLHTLSINRGTLQHASTSIGVIPSDHGNDMLSLWSCSVSQKQAMDLSYLQRERITWRHGCYMYSEVTDS